MTHDGLIFNSPIGTLEITAFQGSITHLTPLSGEVPSNQPKVDLLTTAAQEINAYLQGTLKHFSVPLHTEGSEIQQAVWHELQRIPYGEVMSYSEMATRIGKPKAVRAVGSACGANPIPVIIPCHRVLRSDGSLGGFGWGLDVKDFLLAMERGQLKKTA
jgi:methylated-DNA-[protein]-cysteine S-methyltransferase